MTDKANDDQEITGHMHSYQHSGNNVTLAALMDDVTRPLKTCFQDGGKNTSAPHGLLFDPAKNPLHGRPYKGPSS